MIPSALLSANAIRLDNLRYFATGITLLIAAGLILRALDRLTGIFACWCVFHGKCCACDGNGTLAVSFRDRNQLSHTAAFFSEDPASGSIRVGDDVVIALKRTYFISGDYPASLAEASSAGKNILLRSEQKKMLRKKFVTELLKQTVLCGIAAAAFLMVMKYYFPYR